MPGVVPLELHTLGAAQVVLEHLHLTAKLFLGVLPNHWNGVCGFGTKPPTETVTEAEELYFFPSSTQLRPSSAMPRVSSSVSVGRPVRKYSFMRRQPWL